MNKINVHLDDGRISHIYVGEKIENITQYLDNRKTIIITENTIYELYKNKFPANIAVIKIAGGEKNKTLATISGIVENLIEKGIDRESFIVGIGGGIVCDITGFIASIYMRGLRFGFVATTLLAQVDASVGGKNGVNFNKYKNILGVFNQPDFVICDINMLQTLPPRELRAGLAEVVKTALIADKDMFDYIKTNSSKILGINKNVISFLVKRCVEIKASVVEADEKESGERRKLNLGHTFGHAIEKHSDLLHGEAISIGLMITAKISQKLNLISKADVDRVRDILSLLELPIKIDIDENKLLDAVTKDKKRNSQSIHFVLNQGIGGSIVKNLTFDELNKLYSSI